MGAKERAKGARGERQVAAAFTLWGHDVLQLQRNRADTTDLLINSRVYVEVKNQARLQLPMWMRALRKVVGKDTPAVVAFKMDGEWYTAVPLGWFAELLPAPIEKVV